MYVNVLWKMAVFSPKYFFITLGMRGGEGKRKKRRKGAEK